jgi:hypothetical protein
MRRTSLEERASCSDGMSALLKATGARIDRRRSTLE